MGSRDDRTFFLLSLWERVCGIYTRHMAMKLQHCMVTIVYKLRVENSMADALSRQEWRLQDEEDELSSGAGGLGPSSGVCGALRSSRCWGM